MHTYRCKHKVEAMRWTDTDEDREAFYQWFDRHECVFETRGPVIVLPDDLGTADKGDWVLWSDGEIIVMDDEAFRDGYDDTLAEVARLSHENSAHRALAMLEPKEMSYADRAEFERLKRADVEQGKRIAALTLSPSECEALQYARERLAATHNVKNVYIAESLAALDKVLAANGGE